MKPFRYCYSGFSFYSLWWSPTTSYQNQKKSTTRCAERTQKNAITNGPCCPPPPCCRHWASSSSPPPTSSKDWGRHQAETNQSSLPSIGNILDHRFCIVIIILVIIIIFRLVSRTRWNVITAWQVYNMFFLDNCSRFKFIINTIIVSIIMMFTTSNDISRGEPLLHQMVQGPTRILQVKI